ncbi:hypothetical protein [Enterococcus phage PEF9]
MLQRLQQPYKYIIHKSSSTKSLDRFLRMLYNSL